MNTLGMNDDVVRRFLCFREEKISGKEVVLKKASHFDQLKQEFREFGVNVLRSCLYL